jgi:hypothetical protein
VENWETNGTNFHELNPTGGNRENGAFPVRSNVGFQERSECASVELPPTL